MEDNRLIGYARVSTEDQDIAMQRRALVAGGVRDDHIFHDVMTGKKMKRPGLKRAILCCYPGDVLVVWKLDRLGRSVRGVLDAVEMLDKRGVGLRSLTEPIDTTTPMGKMVMTILLALAEMESNLTSERTRAGLANFVANGGRMGPKPYIAGYPKRLEAFKKLRDGELLKNMSGQQIVDVLNEADPDAPQIKGPQVYSNWKAKGFPGLEIDADTPLEAVE